MRRIADIDSIKDLNVEDRREDLRDRRWRRRERIVLCATNCLGCVARRLVHVTLALAAMLLSTHVQQLPVLLKLL